MKRTAVLAGFIALSVPILIQTATVSAQAAQPQHNDGSVHFDRPPSLLDVGAMRGRDRDGIYYFTLNVPADAGAALAGVVIHPQDQSDPERELRFDLDETEVFLGTSRDRGAELQLQTVGQTEAPTRIQIIFAQPLNPDTTVTVGLKPSRRPNHKHTYQFGVTAVPAAANSAPVFLGDRQIRFEDNRYREYPFWWSRDDVFPFYNETDRRVLFWDLPPEFDPRLRRRRAD